MCSFFYLLLFRMIDALSLGNIDAENPGKDDFELWSPSEERPEQCLFGRQVWCINFLLFNEIFMLLF